MAQLVARCVRDAEVAGSNPVTQTINVFSMECRLGLAQFGSAHAWGA